MSEQDPAILQNKMTTPSELHILSMVCWSAHASFQSKRRSYTRCSSFLTPPTRTSLLLAYIGVKPHFIFEWNKQRHIPPIRNISLALAPSLSVLSPVSPHPPSYQSLNTNQQTTHYEALLMQQCRKCRFSSTVLIPNILHTDILVWYLTSYPSVHVPCCALSTGQRRISLWR